MQHLHTIMEIYAILQRHNYIFQTSAQGSHLMGKCMLVLLFLNYQLILIPFSTQHPSQLLFSEIWKAGSYISPYFFQFMVRRFHHMHIKFTILLTFRIVRRISTETYSPVFLSAGPPFSPFIFIFTHGFQPCLQFMKEASFALWPLQYEI